MAYENQRRPVTFALVVPVTIGSLLCSSGILLFFFMRWQQMIQKSLHHQVVFLLVIISFLYTAFDLPFSINYMRIGYHPYRSIPFCLWWYWFDYTLQTMSLVLAATASIQRHVLVFHSNWLQNQKRRIALHYFPLICCVIYSPSFYIALMFIYSCELYYEPDGGWCAYPCYLDDAFLYRFDWFLNIVAWTFLILFANILLILRAIFSMRRVRIQNGNLWKRQRKLTLQMLAITSVYLIVFLPTTTVTMLRAYLLPDLYIDVPGIYNIFHMIYFLLPVQPFLCVFALPELMLFLKRTSRRIRFRTRVVSFTPGGAPT